MEKYEIYKQLFRDKNMPLAFIDLDLLDKNINDITSQMDGTGKTIRLASKSLRVPDMIKYVLKAKQMQGILAYSATEAVFLSQQGIDDIIIAYPVVNKEYIREVLKEENRILLMVDSIEHVDIISEVANTLSVTAKLCMDLDLSAPYPGVYFGVYRSSIRNIKDVDKLGAYIKEKNNVELVAVMGYEAQIAGVSDRSPARNFILNAMVRFLKKNSIKRVAKFRSAAIQLLKKQGHDLILVNGGGTGSVKSTKMETEVTEVTVGSGFFSPGLFDDYDDFHYAPAEGFAIEVTRKPIKGIFTCHGGGYIASGSIGIDKQPKIHYPVGAKFITDEGFGEVQTPIKYNGDLELGDPIILRHAKAGELAEHFNEIHIIKEGEIIETVKTYRGHGKKFL